jgi:hypothetical protein
LWCFFYITHKVESVIKRIRVKQRVCPKILLGHDSRITFEEIKHQPMKTPKNQERVTEPFSPTFTPNPPQVMNPSMRPEKNLSVVITIRDGKSKKETVQNKATASE